MTPPNGRVILGLDPGSGRTGFGAVRRVGDELEFMECGCLSTTIGGAREKRLLELYTQLCDLFDRVRPDTAAVEELFFNRNVNTAMAVGEARGVILLVAAQRGVAIEEFTPSAVKEAVTGYGNASKSQVCEVVMMHLGLETKPRPDDASDGLALALCQIFHEDLGG